MAREYIEVLDSLHSILSVQHKVHFTNFVEEEGVRVRYENHFIVTFEKNDYTEDWNSFTIPKKSPKNVSYWPEAKAQPRNESGFWSLEGRRMMKFSDFLIKYVKVQYYHDFSKRFVDGQERIFREFEGVQYSYADLVKSQAIKDKILAKVIEDIITINKSKDASISPRVREGGNGNIKDIYETMQYEGDSDSENAELREGSGRLMRSCMRPYSDHNVKFYSAFYDLCPCSIVYDVNEDDELMYRALLWKLDDGRTYLDRVYGTERTQLAVREWANEKGYITRTYDSKLNENITVTLSDEAYKYIMEVGCPYVDSFQYVRGKKIYNLEPEEGAEHEMMDTSGRSLDGKKTCPICEERRNGNDFRTAPDGEDICDSCFDEKYAHCTRCNNSYEKHLVFDCDGEEFCGYCAERSGFNFCARCGEWQTDCIYVDVDDEWICEDCFDKADYFKCNDCLEYFSDAPNIIEIATGEERNVCDVCADAYKVCDDCGILVKEITLSEDFDGSVKALCTHCYNSIHKNEEKESVQATTEE